MGSKESYDSIWSTSYVILLANYVLKELRLSSLCVYIYIYIFEGEEELEGQRA